jgi:hypothetical protein
MGNTTDILRMYNKYPKEVMKVVQMLSDPEKVIEERMAAQEERGDNFGPYYDRYNVYRPYLDADNNFIDKRGRNSGAYQEIQKGLADLYYEQFVDESIKEADLEEGIPIDFVADMNQAFDEYTRRDPYLMHVGVYGYDPDGTAAEWASSAGSGPDRLANIGRIHYGKFGKKEGRELLLPGYYDAQGNRVRAPESSALNEILNTVVEGAPYQEYEPGLNFLTNQELEDQGVELTDLMKRNMSLRPEKFQRKAAPQRMANDYIEYLKDPGNEELMNIFKGQMNLTPELVGTDDTEALRSLMEIYGAGAFTQGLGNPDVEMPTYGLPQVFQFSPERETDTYVDNMKRLYQKQDYDKNVFIPEGYSAYTTVNDPKTFDHMPEHLRKGDGSTFTKTSFRDKDGKLQGKNFEGIAKDADKIRSEAIGYLQDEYNKNALFQRMGTDSRNREYNRDTMGAGLADRFSKANNTLGGSLNELMNTSSDLKFKI